ncbi:MAG TPA: Fe(2+)-trafficking protein [Vicinamibacteria bacterium]|nr:Fe(2+)-trafficking protein [Vicinamibacteria bacterium]
MSLHCQRCGKDGEAPTASKVAFLGDHKARVLEGICGECWKEWEAVEVKVINEYRLNFMDPEHREALKRACVEFLGLQ